MQALLVAENIVRDIRGRTLKAYVPSLVDGAIELTLGLVSRRVSTFVCFTSLDLA
jgi:hypothetical protein